MNRFYKQLDSDDREYVRSVAGKYSSKNEYSCLNERTVQEKISKVLLSHSDKTVRIPSVIDREIEEELVRSVKLFDSRKGKCIDIEPLKIYKGLVTTSLIEVDGGENKETGNEKLVWEFSRKKNEYFSTKLIKWDDIMVMSTIYTVLERNSGFTRTPEVEISAFECLSAVNPYRRHTENEVNEFASIMNDSITRFNLLCGTYSTRDSKDDPYQDHVIMDGFFFDYIPCEDGFAFSDDGKGTFQKSKYQMLCEKSSRIANMNPKYLDCDSLEDFYALSYLFYRHDSVSHDRKGNQKPVISFDTMRKVLGRFPTEGTPYSYGEMRNSVRKWRGMLKPLFKGARIENDRISWEKEVVK